MPEPFEAPFTVDQAKEIIRRAYMLYPDKVGAGGIPGLVGTMPAPGGIAVDARRAQAEKTIASLNEDQLLQLADQIMVMSSPKERPTLSAGITDFYNQQEQRQKQEAEAAAVRNQFFPGSQPPAEPDPFEGLDPVTAIGLREIIDQVDWTDPTDIALAMAEVGQWIIDNPGDEGAYAFLDALSKAHSEAIKSVTGTQTQYTSTKEAFDRTLAENRRQFGITSGISQGQLDVSRGGLEETKRTNVEQEKQSIRAELARLQARRGEAELTARTNLAGSTLPPGTPFVPGYEPGGAAAKLFGGYGAPFTPVQPGQVNVSLAPTEAEHALARALAGMSGGPAMGSPGAPALGQAVPYSPQIANELALQAVRGPRL